VLRERDLERRRRRERELAARRAREERARRTARRAGAVGFVAAAALPVLLWRRTVAGIASEFELEATYLVTGWAPWLLMALGLLCFVPVLVSLARSRRRFYGGASGAWMGWGCALYLLGFALATQVQQLAEAFGT
jgi:hypothetical protein